MMGSTNNNQNGIRVCANDAHFISLGNGRLSTGVTLFNIPIGLSQSHSKDNRKVTKSNICICYFRKHHDRLEWKLWHCHKGSRCSRRALFGVEEIFHRRKRFWGRNFESLWKCQGSCWRFSHSWRVLPSARIYDNNWWEQLLAIQLSAKGSSTQNRRDGQEQCERKIRWSAS